MLDFTGEIGGMLGMAFGMGAVAGWGFGEKKTVAPMKAAHEKREAELKALVTKAEEDCDERITAMQKDITHLRAECEKLNQWMLDGMTRQLQQVRQSTLTVIGEPGPTRMVGGPEEGS